MYRAALRASTRSATRSSIGNTTPRRFAGRLNVPPADGPRSWKGSLARWGLAAGGIWYYNTSDVFADGGAAYSPKRLPIAEAEDENLPTVDAISAARKTRQSQQSLASSASTSPNSALSIPTETSAATQAAAATNAVPMDGPEAGSVEALEEEAGQQGAYNEETGEINWDCPCLGGMAHGPCGPEFREAFSCFIYSKDEPKGIDCIDRFKGMQDCFRAHPDIYGAELSDDEDESQGPSADEFEAPLTADSASTPDSNSSNHAKTNRKPTRNSNSNTSAPSTFESDPAKHHQAPGPVAIHHDSSHGDAVPNAAYSATTTETSLGMPPGATKGEDEESKTKRAKQAKEQVERDHGGKESETGSRSEGSLATGADTGSMMDDKEVGGAKGKPGGW